MEKHTNTRPHAEVKHHTFTFTHLPKGEPMAFYLFYFKRNQTKNNPQVLTNLVTTVH